MWKYLSHTQHSGVESHLNEILPKVNTIRKGSGSAVIKFELSYLKSEGSFEKDDKDVHIPHPKVCGIQESKLFKVTYNNC